MLLALKGGNVDKERINLLTRFIVESDAIEGIENDTGTVQNQIVARKKDGHVGALLFLESLAGEKIDLVSEEMICFVQKFITQEQHLKPGGGNALPLHYSGQYRRHNVRVGNSIPPPFAMVAEMMRVFLEKVKKWQMGYAMLHTISKESKVKQVAQFHFEYEHIHPFMDGNGRSGRALVYYLFRYADMRPFIFTVADKHETYYRCFQNPSAMCKYFLDRI